jgi:dimethylargininase
MKTAILNQPTPALAECELTFIRREPIHFETVWRQHAAYAAALQRVGVRVALCTVNQASPDAVFVEDHAIILDEIAIMASMGSVSRRSEVGAMAGIISGFREIKAISLPATIEGGDVLRVGKTLFVGLSSRTNEEGFVAFEEIARLYGYLVIPVTVHGCLHLKTGVTALNDETFIRNPAWFDATPFRAVKWIDVPPDEPWAANVLRIGETIIVNAACPRTADIIERLGFNTERVDISELNKAEAGLTCMSLIF